MIDIDKLLDFSPDTYETFIKWNLTLTVSAENRRIIPSENAFSRKTDEQDRRDMKKLKGSRKTL